MTAAAPLHMLKLPVDERRFYTFAAAQGLYGGDGDTDEGYVLHALLAALFGTQAPKPFAGRRDRGGLAMLAYASAPLETLEAAARLQAEPDAYRIVDWEQAASKPMPASFPAGQLLGFTVKVLPLVRVGRGHPMYRAGAEVDAFLAAVQAERQGPKPDRERTYQQWVADQFGRQGAEVLDMEFLARRRVTLLRKKSDGTRHRLKQHPELEVAGTLLVKDAGAFETGLARGIGRHRAFGYGMLLLKPAGG